MNSPLEVLDRLRAGRLLVVGDAMLDRYVWGDVGRISPEAPVPILRCDMEEVRLGAAASVATLAVGLGAQVSLCSLIGDDSPGRTVLRLLQEAGIGHAGVLVDSERPTTEKLRFLGRAEGRHTQQLLRVDREECAPIPSYVEERLTEYVADQIAQHDVILVSDYAKGLCTTGLLSRVIRLAADAGVPVLVDPARLNDYERYRGANCLLPNRIEAQLACGLDVGESHSARAAAKSLGERAGVAMVLLKLDRDGLLLWESEGDRYVTVPAQARQVYDVTGAGDMVLAMAGLAVASGLTLREGAVLANVAAGLEVEKLGVAAVSREEIRYELTRCGDRRAATKILNRGNLAALAGLERREGRKIVFTNGCFDLLHVGHVTYLEQAAALGDVLIVGVNSDRGVRDLKGPSRPVVNERDRASMLAALGCVDYVVVFDEPTPHGLLELIRPDVLVKGGTYTEQEVVGREVVLAYGGEVCVVGAIDGVSTTQLIGQIANASAQASNPALPLASPVSPASAPAQPPVRSQSNTSCAHRGAITGSVRCPTCKLPVRVHVYQCALFEYCTIPVVGERYHACNSCESRLPLSPEASLTSVKDLTATIRTPIG